MRCLDSQHIHVLYVIRYQRGLLGNIFANILGAKQDLCSKNLGAMKDYSSNILGAKQDFCSSSAGRKGDPVGRGVPKAQCTKGAKKKKTHVVGHFFLSPVSGCLTELYLHS